MHIVFSQVTKAFLKFNWKGHIWREQKAVINWSNAMVQFYTCFSASVDNGDDLVTFFGLGTISNVVKILVVFIKKVQTSIAIYAFQATSFALLIFFWDRSETKATSPCISPFSNLQNVKAHKHNSLWI